MDVIYTLSGGSWLQQLLNGVATFTQSSDFSRLVAMGTTLSVVITAVAYIGKKDLMLFVKWAAYLVLITGILLGVKRSVQVIDLSEPSQVYQVDNVPLGIAMPFSLITGVGYGLTQAYEMVFTNPDAMTYSRTGMLFGASLVNASTDFASTNPEIAGLFSDYVQDCVVGDILLNHKYSMNELMNTTDPYSLIFSNPSPLRGVFKDDGTFETCQEAAAELQKNIVTDSSTGGGSWEYYVRHLMGGRTDATALFGQLMGDSYSYFYGSSQTASEIMKSNVTINALRHGISSYATRSGDTASLMNLSTETSFEKLRLSQSTSAKIATEQLPLMHTLVMGMLLGLFPVVIVLALAGTMPWNILRTYILMLMSLQMWPVLFAVLNSCINYRLRVSLGDMTPTLSNLSLTQQKYSDLAGLAGYAALFIPPAAYFLAFAMEKGMLSMLGGMTSAIQGPAGASSSQAVDGQWSINNMQTDNVQGHKWDTNSNVADGQMTAQLQNGASATKTAGGGTVYNTTGATSKLSTDISSGQLFSSTSQRAARETHAQAESSLAGFNHSSNSAYNQAKQFTEQHGNSDTQTTGADHTQSSTETRAVHRMQSAAHSYAVKNNISDSQGWAELQSKTRDGRVNVGGTVSGGFNIGVAKAEGHVGVEGTVSKGSQSSADEKGSASTDHSRSDTSQEVKDFKEGKDTLESYRASQSGSHADNVANSQLEQIGATLSVADNQYQQYTEQSTRSHEYSQMASASDTASAQENSNYAQEFVGYVQNKAPDRAEAILTDTASPEVRAEREQLAGQFMEEKLRSRVEGNFESSRASLSDGMGNVPHGASAGNRAVQQAGEKEISQRSQAAGIRGDVPAAVAHDIHDAHQHIADDNKAIDVEAGNIKTGGRSQQKEVDVAKQDFSDRYNKSVEHQKLMAGDNPNDVFDDAKKMKGNSDDKK